MDDDGTRPRRAIWWYAAGLVLAGVAAAVWMARTATLRSIGLADGSTLIFQGVTVGTNCEHAYGSYLSRIGALLPVEFARFFPPAEMVDRRFFETNIVFWIEWTDISKPRPSVRFTLSDERGSGMVLPAPAAEQPLLGGSGGFSVATPVWPRDAGTLVLRVFDETPGGAKRPLGEWTIRNPQRSARVSWKPDALPVGRETGRTTVTLERFEIRPMPVLARTVAGTNLIEPMAFLRFSWTNASGSGPTNLRPRLVGICVSDSFGNSTPWARAHATESGNQVHASLVKLPWAGAPTYRVSTRWASLDAQGSSERVSVQVLLLTRPGPGQAGRTAGIAPYRDGEVRITGRIAQRSSSSAAGTVLSADIRRLALPSFSEYQVNLVAAVDRDGRRWVPDDQGEIEVPAEVKSVSVEAEVRLLKTLEFTAEPVRSHRSAPERAAELR